MNTERLAAAGDIKTPGGEGNGGRNHNGTADGGSRYWVEVPEELQLDFGLHEFWKQG